MAGIIVNFTPSSAVATAGTMAFVLANASVLGQVTYDGNHVLYAEGLGAQFAFPKDFTIAWSGSTATVTYNGTTTIPAGSLVRLELSTAGEKNYLTDNPAGNVVVKDILGNVRAVPAKPMRVLFGAPIAAAATTVLATTAVLVTTLVTLATPVVLDVPRGLAVKSSTTDTTQTVTVRGFDEYGVAMTETFTLNGVTAVNGKKAFKTVTSYQASIALAGNLSIGVQAGVLGLPYFLQGGTGAGAGFITGESADGARPTAGTFVGGDLTLATATTGDVRGTYTPNTAPNAVHIYEFMTYGSDVTFKGVPQYGL